MKKLKLLSWNINGLRAIYKKGFSNWVRKEDADILCVQEIKVQEQILAFNMKYIINYDLYFSSADKKGYSGVLIYSKEKPNSIKNGLGIEKFDREGRILIAKYPKFTLFNIYFPNGGASEGRLKYKMDFYNIFLSYLNKLKDKNIIICGDVNTAHKEIDLTRPKENSKKTGFLPKERAWIDKLLNLGYIDTFRVFNKEPNQYSWWDYKTKARERNVGWRLDYFFINKKLKKNLKSAFILNKVVGSDHCPVGIEILI